MSVVNNQQLLVSGSVLMVAPIDKSVVPNTVGAWRDVGTIQVANPNPGATKIQLKDARGGRLLLVDERNIEYTEAYEITCSNMSLENLIYIFGANAVQTFSQSATQQSSVAHTVFPDSYLRLHDASGNYFYNIASVQSIGSLVLGTDFTTNANDLKMGRVKILPGASGVSSSGTSLNVTFTPTAISGQRYFNPQTAGIAYVEIAIFWTSDDWTTIQLRDHVTATITPAQPEFKDSDYSSMKFNLSIVSDPTNAARPAGRVLQPIGAIPARTY